jgi:AraC family transcriptional regulator
MQHHSRGEQTVKQRSLSLGQREHVKRLLKVLVFIEQHLDEELKLESLASLAYFSPFHFHRLFSAYVGESLNGYIRRLRLERAAQRLRMSKHEVTSIALDAGFETHSAFSQAFRKCWGETPSRYRMRVLEQELQLRIFHKQKDFTMEVQLMDRPNMDVIFIRRLGDYNESAPAAFMALKHLIESKGFDINSIKMYGIAHDDPDVTPKDKVRYDACMMAPPGIKPEGELSPQRLPAGKYARFTHVGSLENLPATYDYIYCIWYPQSGENLADRPCIIEYVPESQQQDRPTEERICYVYLPLKE